MIFKLGDFVASSGRTLPWKVECDDFSLEDWMNIADIVGPHMLPFGTVEGVPYGGLNFAAGLYKYRNPDSDVLLIVDDVLTTGTSMEKQRNDRQARGLVLFSRGDKPPWVRAVWEIGPWLI